MPRMLFDGDFPGNVRDLFQWHERPGAIERLLPPWQNARILSSENSLKPGSKVVVQIKAGPLPLKWEVEHVDYTPPTLFSDQQIKGPFRQWTHHHHFSPTPTEATHLQDDIEFESPLSGVVKTELKRAFRYRHDQLRIDLQRHQLFSTFPKLRIAISGSSGLIGTQLASFLSTGGHEVLHLVRCPAQNSHQISWEPLHGTIETEKLEGIDAVIHLAGAGIADGRWTQARKKMLRQSRIQGTRLLAQSLAELSRPPKVFISMSGAGHYGYSDFTTTFTENHSPADDFLATLTVDWEKSTAAATQAGIRTVIFRTPMVLTARGGALGKMLPPFLMGAGGKIGSGTQPMSWVALDDLLGIFLFALYTETLNGPVNVSVPSVPTNREFTQVLGKVLRRPTIAPLPGFVVKMLFGEMGQALLLGGQEIDSSKLTTAGFSFLWGNLEQALRHELGRQL